MAVEITPVTFESNPDLQGKFLIVDTKADGYSGVVSGRYNHEITNENGEYQVYPTTWSDTVGDFVREQDLVVVTKENKVDYIVNTNNDPYNPPLIKSFEIQGDTKELAVLHAFKHYADSRFSLGNYNLFLADGVLLGADPDFVSVTGVTLDKQTGSLYVGDTVELTATIAPENATDKTVTFTSSDSTVASVTQNGAKATVKALKAGTATITVTSKNNAKSATYVATITLFVSVTGVTLDKTEIALEIGGKSTVKATVAPSNATNKAVTFSTSAKEIATVDAKGEITAVSAGTATVTATTADGKKTASSAVTVAEPASEPEP